MNLKRMRLPAISALLAVCLAGCGSGGNSAVSNTPPATPPATPTVTTYSVGGTISGLTASGLVLTDGSQTVSPASGATSFTFPASYASGTSYSVTVQTQPNSESCTVTGGSGTAASSNVTSVAVSCGPMTYTIGGEIVGLTTSGLVLADGSQTVSPASGATSFTFPTAGASYSVIVQTQPSGETCTVFNGSGTFGLNVTDVIIVACTAAHEVVLYSFLGGTSDGYDLNGSLVRDTNGNLYGTTVFGGANDDGTVFKLTPDTGGSYTERVLNNFQGSWYGGFYPKGGLILDGNGNLYGTTSGGGFSNNCPSCGLVFKFSPGSGGIYTENELYDFQEPTPNGQSPTPSGSLFMDDSGNLYGTTLFGGLTANCSNGCGTVFKLVPYAGGGYNESVLYSFHGGTSDGAEPSGNLTMDNSGNLYGTTGQGGSGSCTTTYSSGCGIIFRLTPGPGGTYTESVLYNFQGGTSDGNGPNGGLVRDESGNLYGTTEEGGGTFGGVGTVFKLIKGSDGNYTESLLHSFQGGTDGVEPGAGLVMDGSGNLYGTASVGGPGGYGNVFKLTKGSDGSYTKSVLWSFQGGTSDGAEPGGLIMDSSGNLYGTTAQGGPGDCSSLGWNGCGTVFEIIP